MKIVRLFFLIIVTIFITGCSVNYEIEIDENLFVKESLYFDEFNEVIKETYIKFEEEMQITVVENVHDITNRLRAMLGDSYTIKAAFFDDRSGISITNNYSSLSNYQLSEITKRLYGSINFSKRGDIIDLVSKSPYKFEDIFIPDADFLYDIENFSVSIKLPFKVLEHNADKVSNNTYTWNFDYGMKDKYINLRFDIGDGRNPNQALLLIVAGILGLCIIGSAVGFVIYQKFENKNEI